MILLIAHRAAQRSLRAALRAAARGLTGCPDIRLVAPAALSLPGWVHDPGSPAAGRLALDGETCPAGKVTAVLTALDAVWPADLPHVRAADRAFVAGEMTAFLRGWLAGLDCPVLDPPTALALSGPAGERAAWSAAAAALGVPDRQATAVSRLRAQTVTVAAGRVFGSRPESVPAEVADTAVALTRAAGVTAARLTFTDDRTGGVPALSAAIPWWYAPDPLALRALLERVPARRRGAAADGPAPAGRRAPRAAARPGRPLVLLWGVPEEGPLAAVRAALGALGTPVVLADQRDGLAARFRPADGRQPDGPLLTLPGGSLPLSQVTAAYPRPYPSIPELPSDLPARRTARRHLIRLEHELWHWLGTTTALVANRPAPAASNGTKSLQSRVAGDCGFAVPESLLTNDPETALAFAARHGRVIYKGAGGSRTITGLLDPADTSRLARLGTCPVYLQRYVAGTNVRVHVVGTEVFAVEITSDTVDYRLAPGELRPARLPDGVADRCRTVIAALGLVLAGIDLIRTPASEWFFLEANPSPGFTFYPDRDLVGMAIARLLSGQVA